MNPFDSKPDPKVDDPSKNQGIEKEEELTDQQKAGKAFLDIVKRLNP